MAKARAGLVEGKGALVTGGASGIGRESALLLAAEGARVLVADVDAEGVEATADAIRAAGGTAHAMAVDVTEEAQVEAMVETCLAELGGLDCALNNAGVSGPTGPLDGVALGDWSRTLAVNLTGVFLCMKHEIPAMKARGGGAIVNMASGSGWIATPGLAPYCATKHGVLGLTKTAAVENARTGVRVNAVCPGSIDTPMLQGAMAMGEAVAAMIRASMPIGRLGEPREVAEAVVWLCSDRASLVTGASMGVDGGSVAR
jgi:NAD(P)-dependent dehydrogenase (short-subunit alcohol dehydrogenase family)